MKNTTLKSSISLIEDLIHAVEKLQGLCGWEPPEDTDRTASEQADWVWCEVVANTAQHFVDCQRPGGE